MKPPLVAPAAALTVQWDRKRPGAALSASRTRSTWPTRPGRGGAVLPAVSADRERAAMKTPPASNRLAAA